MRPSSDLKADQLIDGAECKTTRTCPVLLPFLQRANRDLQFQRGLVLREIISSTPAVFASRLPVKCKLPPLACKGQPGQKSAVDQREDRRVDAYRHCQRTNRDGAKSTRFRQQPQRSFKLPNMRTSWQMYARLSAAIDDKESTTLKALILYRDQREIERWNSMTRKQGPTRFRAVLLGRTLQTQVVRRQSS